MGERTGDRQSRRRDRRILLGLDHQPSVVAREPHEAGDRREVDAAIAGNGEHAAANAGVEARVVGADAGETVGAHVLQVNVVDAVAEAVDERP